MIPTVALPPKVRATCYLVFGILGVALTATQAGIGAAEIPQPTAVAVAWAVYGALGAGFGITATSNTTVGDPTDQPHPRHGLDADGDGQVDVA